MRKRSRLFRPLTPPTASFSWRCTPIIAFRFWPLTQLARAPALTPFPSRPCRAYPSPRLTSSLTRLPWTHWRSAGTRLSSPMAKFLDMLWPTKQRNKTKVSVFFGLSGNFWGNLVFLAGLCHFGYFLDLVDLSLKVSCDPPVKPNGEILGYVVAYKTAEQDESKCYCAEKDQRPNH